MVLTAGAGIVAAEADLAKERMLCSTFMQKSKYKNNHQF